MATQFTPSAISPAPNSTLPLLDRVAIVTGSSRGIGKGVALHLASLGAKVVINYVSNSARADEVVSQINSSWAASSSSPRAISVKADVSEPDQVKALFDAAERAFNDQVLILIACAGISDSSYPSIVDTTIESFDRTLAINTRGTFLLIKEGAQRMKRGGGGRIITFSARFPNNYLPGFGAFSASIAGVEAMTKVLSKELTGTKITANCVAPGATVTETFFEKVPEELYQPCIDASPLLRLGQTKDIAALIGFLVSDDGEWVTGQVIGVAGHA